MDLAESVSGLWTAAARARESSRPDRLFVDPWASALAGERGRHQLTLREPVGLENPYLPIRTRHFDDVLRESTTWAAQVVILGAGMDTRAFRMRWPAALTVFEVDRPEVFEHKEQVLADAAATCERRLVATDLAGDWDRELLDSGFRQSLPTHWVAEGVFYCLTADEVARLLTTAARLADRRSAFAADVFGSGLLRLPAMQPVVRQREKTGRALPFCSDDPIRLLASNGWSSVDVRHPGQLGVRYGRRRELDVERAPAGDPTLRSYLVNAVNE